MNYWVDQADSKRGRGCNLNSGPLGTFFRNLPYIVSSRALPKAHAAQHSLPGLWSQILGSGTGMPQMSLLLAESSSQGSQHLAFPHVRPLRLSQRPDHPAFFPNSAGIKSPLDFYPLANIRPSMTWNPPNAAYNKWQLFSIILTRAFSFPSLGAFFPWLKAYAAEQVSAAYTAPDIRWEDTQLLWA